jgi:hypothetical protein
MAAKPESRLEPNKAKFGPAAIWSAAMSGYRPEKAQLSSRSEPGRGWFPAKSALLAVAITARNIKLLCAAQI